MKLYKLSTHKHNTLQTVIFLFLFFGFSCSNVSQAASTNTVAITHLKVEYTETPLGIDVEKPRFSWQMEATDNQRGCKQTAWQIIVTNEKGEQVWDSGKIKDSGSINKEYDGMPLQPTTRYHWEVNVWDNKGMQSSASSWFETGLMCGENTYENWSNAKWIGGGDEDMVFYSHYLSVFRLSYSIQLDESTKTLCAGLVYGANDERLMSKNKNLYNIESNKDESYIKIELNIAPLATGKEARLNVYRVGYHPNDKIEVPLQNFPLSIDLINQQNCYNQHTISLSSEYGITRLYFDNASKEVGSIVLNPVGRGGDYIAFPMLADVGYWVPAKQAATFSNVQVSNYRSPSNGIATLQDNALKIEGGSTGTLQTFTPQGNALAMLRTRFTNHKTEIAKARLYITARGIYEVYLNGVHLGDDYFNPGITQYNKTHLYQTFDVTEHILTGDNVLGATLAEGWWSGAATYTGENWNLFGDRQSLLAKLVITYTDGTEKIVTTQPSSWQFFNKGPVLYGSIFQGEVYDATREKVVEGWSTVSYDAFLWKPACEVALEEHISAINDYSTFKLIGQSAPTVKAVKELTACSVKEVHPGVFVYDMGQNMAGVPKIHLSGLLPGTKVNFRFAEVTYPDLPEYKDNVGMIMLENIRAALAQDIYIAKGGEEDFSPRFTYHGYRFVEITGIDKPLPLGAVKGIVVSSIHQLTAHYETSNSKVNQLWENITWSSYANFISIPTDCPQRNERMGWAGDISVFSRTSTYLANVAQFLRSYLNSTRDVQSDNGRFADIAPVGGGFGGVLWGSAGITVPWECYQQYEDKALLSEHYDAMKRYISYILDNMIDKESGLLVQNRAWGDLCDWLGLEDEKNDKSLVWEAYFIYDLELMSRMATILSKSDDAQHFQKLRDERKKLFNKVYINPETGKTQFSEFVPQKVGRPVDTQTSYVLPLAFDAVAQEHKEKFIQNFINTVTRENSIGGKLQCPPYSLMTGFIGTAWICKALSDNGCNEIAYRLLQQTGYPSWLYPVEQGATTIWERLNSYTHLNGFGGNNGMNSFNHYSFGAVGSWMYNYSLGIQRDKNAPAFKHFLLKPTVDPSGEMKYAKGYYESLYGRIESSWSVEDNSIIYQFTVPANTSASLYLPASSIKDVQENGKTIGKKSKGITFTSKEGDYLLFELQSGFYSFEVKK